MKTTTRSSLGSAHQLVPLAPGHEKLPTEPAMRTMPGVVCTARPRPETIIGAGRIGVADQVLDLRTDLVRQHDYRLAERPAQCAKSRFQPLRESPEEPMIN